MTEEPNSAEGRSAGPFAWRLPVLVAGLFLLLLTRSDAIQVADSGELVAASCNGGVAHPPGYPLYVLLGQALCQLPISTPAGRVELLSLIGGLLALLLLYATVERGTGNGAAAALAALTLATGSGFWRNASQPEVFALNAALSLAIVYTGLRASQSTSPGRHLGWSAAVGLATGLALSNHHSSVLVAPAALAGIALPWRSIGQLLQRVLVAALGLSMGLLPYLQPYLADPANLPRWGNTSTLSGLLHHVLRRDYGGLRLALYGEPAGLSNLLHFAARLPSQTGWVLWLAGLVGMLVLLGRAARRPLGSMLVPRLDRGYALILAVLPLLAGPIFLLLFNITPSGVGAQVVERFHVLPIALLCLWIGVGLAGIEAQLIARGSDPDRSSSRVRLWRGTLVVALALVALWSYPKADLRQSYTVEDWARNALASVEKGALVVGTGDVQFFSIIYAQQVLGLRPDVQFVQVKMLAYPWYVEQKRRERPGFAYAYAGRKINTVGWLQGEHDRRTPIYLAGPFFSERATRAFASYPVGPLQRLLPPTTSSPSPAEVNRLNARLFRGFSDRGRRPERAHDPWSAELLESYARTWRSIAAALFHSGDRRGALRAMARAADWAPWLPVPDWFGPGAGLHPGPEQATRLAPSPPGT